MLSVKEMCHLCYSLMHCSYQIKKFCNFIVLLHIFYIQTGCGVMYVADGNWKLKYSHCMWQVPVNVEGFNNQVNYPDVCPLSPERGQNYRFATSNLPHGIRMRSHHLLQDTALPYPFSPQSNVHSY